MADIAWAAIFRQKRGRKAVLSIEDAGFPFDLPRRLSVQRIERSERPEKLVIAPAPQPWIPGEAMPDAPLAGVVALMHEPIGNPFGKVHPVGNRVAVRVVLVSERHHQYVWPRIQDQKRPFDKLRPQKLPVIFAMQNEVRFYLCIGKIDSRNLPNLLPSIEPGNSISLVSRPKIIVLARISVFDDDKFADRVGIVEEKAVK